jgi:hypothetical protein
MFKKKRDCDFGDSQQNLLPQFIFAFVNWKLILTKFFNTICFYLHHEENNVSNVIKSIWIFRSNWALIKHFNNSSRKFYKSSKNVFSWL